MLLLLFLLLLLVSPLIIGIVLMARKYLKAGGLILGIYAMLIGIFLVHAQLDKRSTSGHIFRWFKGEDGAHQRVNDLAEDAKKLVDPFQLRSWAVTILQEPQRTNSDFEIPRNKVPANIQKLGPFPFEDAFCDPVSVQNRSVWIVWGSGFGHWGMRVGSPTFEIVPAPDDNYYIEWKPGIYFWCETH